MRHGKTPSQAPRKKPSRRRSPRNRHLTEPGHRHQRSKPMRKAGRQLCTDSARGTRRKSPRLQRKAAPRNQQPPSPRRLMPLRKNAGTLLPRINLRGPTSDIYHHNGRKRRYGWKHNQTHKPRYGRPQGLSRLITSASCSTAKRLNHRPDARYSTPRGPSPANEADYSSATVLARRWTRAGTSRCRFASGRKSSAATPEHSAPG